MSAVLVLVWLGVEAARGAHEPDLEAFARARGVALAAPSGGGFGQAGHDERLAGLVEQKLDEARTAATLDDQRAQRLLAEAERALRDDPRLPQSAWLLAERFRIEAALLARREDGRELAIALTERASVLEGDRAQAFGEEALPLPARATVRVEIVAPGADEIFVDAIAVGREASLRVGEHHVLALRAGRVAWAGWLPVEAAGTLRVPVPKAAACSVDELDSVRASERTVLGTAHVACPAWAVARPAARGVEVATCRGARCGAFFRWHRDDGVSYTGPPQPPPAPRRLPWEVLAVVGAAAVATTALVVYAGTSSEDTAREPRRVYTGPNLGALSF